MEDKWREKQIQGYYIEEHDDVIIEVSPNDNWTWFYWKEGCHMGIGAGRECIPRELEWHRTRQANWVDEEDEPEGKHNWLAKFVKWAYKNILLIQK